MQYRGAVPSCSRRLPPDALREAGTDYSDSLRDQSLPAVAHARPERIPELAKQITARADNPYDKARAVEELSAFALRLYTGSYPVPPLKLTPLPTSYSKKRAGHCEYFAAAMTVMLRSVGIPARYINGFLTGEYNDVGGDFVVRASDAHSWSGGLFSLGPDGWLTFESDASSGRKTFR